MILIEFQHCEECFLRHFDVADLLHAFLSFLLFLEEFAFSADVSSVAFCRHVLPLAFYCLSCHDLRCDGGLYGDVELLSGYEFLQFLAHTPSEGDGVIDVCECGESIDALAVEEDVELCEF